MISTSEKLREAGAGELPAKPRFLATLGMTSLKRRDWGRALVRATVWPSVPDKTPLRRMPITEDKKLRKDLTLEVPCFEGTLRKL
jgi:hypothetical protein